MDWMSALVSAIGSVRLILIISGILMLVSYIYKNYGLSEHQKKCFAISGIIYLLGLMPQSLLLLTSNSESGSHLFDSGFLCWTQKFSCIIAVSLHTLIFFTWIFTNFHSDHTESNNNKPVVKRKDFFHVMIIYFIILIVSRIFFLKNDESRKFYMDVASKTINVSTIGWTMLPVQNPSQVVRLQLLLCESSLSESDMKYFLIVCYAALFLPLAFILYILKPLYPKQQQPEDASTICEPNPAEGWQHHAWWEQDGNIMNIFSASIAFWYFLIQPTVFAFQRQHFVDFGTHLLLTICVFIPLTVSSAEKKNSQNWV